MTVLSSIYLLALLDLPKSIFKMKPSLHGRQGELKSIACHACPTCSYSRLLSGTQNCYSYLLEESLDNLHGLQLYTVLSQKVGGSILGRKVVFDPSTKCSGGLYLEK